MNSENKLRAAQARSMLIAAVVGDDEPPRWLTDAIDRYAAASVTDEPCPGCRVYHDLGHPDRVPDAVSATEKPREHRYGEWTARAASATDERRWDAERPLVCPSCGVETPAGEWLGLAALRQKGNRMSLEDMVEIIKNILISHGTSPWIAEEEAREIAHALNKNGLFFD